MPVVHPCAWPRCAALLPVGQTHCAEHRRQTQRAGDGRRGHARARGYTRAWEARAAAFKDVYPLCGMRPGGRPPVMSRCYDEGRDTPAYQVDHVVPHGGDMSLFWDEIGNWQSLCASCGSAKTRAGL